MTAAIPLDVPIFKSRLQRLRSIWKGALTTNRDENEPLNEFDVFMFALGNPEDFAVYQKSTAMFSWLLGYEFPETVVLITKEKVVFLTSQRKGAILDALVADDPQGVLVIKRDKEIGKSEAVFEQVWKAIGKNNQDASERALNLGLLSKDRCEGPMVEEWLHWLNQKPHQKVDVTPIIGGLLAPKDEIELSNIRIAAQLTSGLMTEHACKKILGVIDEGRRVTHLQLTDDIDSFVTNHIGRLKGSVKDEPKLNLEYVDTCYPPIIQSNGSYSLKPSAMSDEEILHSQPGPVLCSLGLRYRAYCANISRTLLIDPSPAQEENLKFIQGLQKHLASILEPGKSLTAVYQAGLEYVKTHQPDLESHLPNNFGYAIGLEFRAPEYLINNRCERTIKQGMVFNLVVGLQDLPQGSSSYSLLIADTVHVGSSPSENTFLTKGLNLIKEVSYSFKQKSRNKSESKSVDTSAFSGIKTRLRSQNGLASGTRDESNEKKRREHQRELGQQRIQEALQKYGALEDGALTANKAVEVVKFESYRKETLLPKDLGANGSLKIFIDKKAETVILPINGLAVPFHINTIKNVTKSEEGDFCYLRINFATPGRGVGPIAASSSKGTSLMEQQPPETHFVRGITLRTADVYRAQETFKEIQELKKQTAEREAARKERADLVEQGHLIEVSGKRPVRLVDVHIRPGPEGKRVPGDVEIHSNGIRYRNQLRGEQKVDVLFANVKHFFFQPCDHETIVIVHLTLHHPIMVGKKKTRDIQFYREALDSTVDETSGRRNKMRFGDEDEIAQEQEERVRRAEANEEFRNFAEKVVEASRGTLEVDVPFRDLGFSGVPSRQNVLLQPTTDCLVHLTEPPFLVVTLSEVEVAFLERVVFGLKNFDLVLIPKDHSQTPVHVNAIPMTQLEAVKEWLDSVDVYFVESKVNFNWTNIMKTVNEDPVGFYEMGGWTFLQPDESNDAADSDEDDGSSEYEPEESDEEDEEDDDDEDEDFSDEDEEEESEEYSDDDEDDDEEEDDAPDWDELEEQARREDERRFQSSKRPPQSKSRAPASKRR